MLHKNELKSLIQKHFNLIKKKKTVDLKQEDEDKLIEYFSNLIYFLQFYDNLDLSIVNSKFMNDNDFITVLCACNNGGTS